MAIRKYKINKPYALHCQFLLQYYALPLEVVHYISDSQMLAIQVAYTGEVPYIINQAMLKANIASSGISRSRTSNLPRNLNELLNPAFTAERRFRWELFG